MRLVYCIEAVLISVITYFNLLNASLGQNSPIRKHKIKKIEIIPADENLLRPQFPEDVEDRLAVDEIRKHSAGRRNRRGHEVEEESADGNDELQNLLGDSVMQRELHAHHLRKSMKVEGPNVKMTEDEELFDDHQNSLDNEPEIPSEVKQAVVKRDSGSNQGSLSDTGNDLLNELKTIRSNIDKAIDDMAHKESKSSEEKTKLDARTLSRLSRELLQKVELATRVKRDSGSDTLLPYRTCIYIDIPGSQPEEEIESFNPEKIKYGCSKSSSSSRDSISTETPSASSDQQIINTDDTSRNIEVLSQNTETEDADVGTVYWLRIPEAEKTDTEEMLTKLSSAIDDFHHSGKDVLFVPISKEYSDAEEVKHGFLKSLLINPERYKNIRRLKIKLI